MKKYFFKTERVGFGIWDPSDLADAIKLWGSKEVSKYIVTAGVMKAKDIEARLMREIDTFSKHGIQYYPIYLLSTNEFIGCCGLRPYDLSKNILELGIHLRKEFWGKGLAQEAGKGIIDYAFEYLKVDGLFAGHNPKNKASARLLVKLGFKYTHDEFYEPTGLYHPSYTLSKDKTN